MSQYVTFVKPISIFMLLSIWSFCICWFEFKQQY